MAEMKVYTREGRFAKKDTLILINALEKFMNKNKQDNPRHRDSVAKGHIKPDGKRMSTLSSMFGGGSRKDGSILPKSGPRKSLLSETTSGLLGKSKERERENINTPEVEVSHSFALAMRELQLEQKRHFENQLSAHKEQADKKIRAQEKQLRAQTDAIVDALEKLDKTLKEGRN